MPSLVLQAGRVEYDECGELGCTAAKGGGQGGDGCSIT